MGLATYLLGATTACPSMPVSLELSDSLDFERVAKIARQVFERHVAITPLKFDVTDWEMLRQISDWSWPETFE